MFKPSVQFNDYVSLAVMLLMVVALVAGQADAKAYAPGKERSVTPSAMPDHRINIDFDGRLSDKALQVSIAVVADSSHFRGEDE